MNVELVRLPQYYGEVKKILELVCICKIKNHTKMTILTCATYVLVCGVCTLLLPTAKFKTSQKNFCGKLFELL